MDIRAAEITSILKEQIKNFGEEAEVSEIDQVLSVGDGIARVYGLDNVQAGEMVRIHPGFFPSALLNLRAKQSTEHKLPALALRTSMFGYHDRYSKPRYYETNDFGAPASTMIARNQNFPIIPLTLAFGGHAS